MKAASIFLTLALAFLLLPSLEGQSPTPILMQPVAPGSLTPTPAPSANPAAAAAETQNMMQLLQVMQATNADTIKKQEAALQTLDVLQKSAEEIKIYSKRG